MKILHVVGGDIFGGAARGAYSLNQALVKQGIDSSLLISQKDTVDKTRTSVIQIENGIKGVIDRELRRFPDEIIRLIYPGGDELFSSGILGLDLTLLEVYKQIDIVHFHWINDGLISIEQFKKIEKPIVWTLHDMWPLTGGCHYDNDCKRYTIGCGKCPQLGSTDYLDISLYNTLRKLDSFKNNIYPVAVSNWLKKSAEESFLFRNRVVNVIPNVIDTDTFSPRSQELKQKLNIPKHKKVILFGAINSMKDKRKGFGYLIKALESLDNKDSYLLLIFGATSIDNKQIENLGINIRILGSIRNDEELSKVYSIADVFVAPSVQEAFGLTIVEAMSCGVPVVAFNSTGPRDIINHKINGYLANPFCDKDLLNGIKWVLLDDDRRKILSLKARKKVIEKYSYQVIPIKYINLYKDILAKNHDFDLKNILQTQSNQKNTLAKQFSRNAKTEIVNDFSDRDFSYNDLIQNALSNYFVDKEIIDVQVLFNKIINDILDTSWTVNGETHIFDITRVKQHLIQVVGCRKLIIFGASSFGNKVKEVLQLVNIKFAFFVDNDKNKLGKMINGIEIKEPILNNKKAYYIIASSWYREIEEQLIKNKFRIKEDYIIIKP